MCGICGFYAYRANQLADGEVLAQMLQRIRHRGPDDQGTYLDRAIGLWHAPLEHHRSGGRPSTDL